jgi:hypothetical protein
LLSSKLDDPKEFPLVKEKSLVIGLSIISKLIDRKFGKKTSETLSNLPNQCIFVLEALCNIFFEIGQEKDTSFDRVLKEVQQILKQFEQERINSNELLECLDQLKLYSLIEINKKIKGNKSISPKNPAILLKTDLTDLCEELDNHPLLA